MCRGSFIGGLILAVILATVPASAQTPKFRLQLQNQLQNQRINRPPPRILLSPAIAARRAQSMFPLATVLKATRLSDGSVRVTLKHKGTVTTTIITP